jgi:AhpD family alkylhydroperoxidase
MRTLLDPDVTIPEPRRETRRAAPESWQRLTEAYPEVVMAYDELSDACRAAGPLGPHTVALIKLAVSVGHSAGRTVHSHAKKALREGVDVEALRQVALIALPTIGLPAALDALKWIDESIREAGAA